MIPHHLVELIAGGSAVDSHKIGNTSMFYLSWIIIYPIICVLTQYLKACVCLYHWLLFHVSMLMLVLAYWYLWKPCFDWLGWQMQLLTVWRWKEMSRERGNRCWEPERGPHRGATKKISHLAECKPHATFIWQKYWNDRIQLKFLKNTSKQRPEICNLANKCPRTGHKPGCPLLTAFDWEVKQSCTLEY